MCIGINLYMTIVVRTDEPQKYNKYYHLVGWGVPFVSTCVPVSKLSASMPVNASSCSLQYWNMAARIPSGTFYLHSCHPYPAHSLLHRCWLENDQYHLWYGTNADLALPSSLLQPLLIKVFPKAIRLSLWSHGTFSVVYVCLVVANFSF